MIYLDYAATSYQKPPQVYRAVYNALVYHSANPGRGGHVLSVRAGDLVYETREKLCHLFHADAPEQFAFFQNTTNALNTAIKGVLSPGDHVVVSSMEHNSVIRPLSELKRRGIIDYTLVAADSLGRILPEDFKRAMRYNTRLVICTHASNVCGNIYDIEAISKLVRRPGTLFLVDAAQSAGHLDIDVSCLDMLAFPGHKGLYGPQGSGGLFVREGILLKTIIEGGTGSQSELLYQPEEMPDRLECGTLNVPAIAGLGAAVDFIMDEGVEALFNHEAMLNQYFEEKIKNIPNVEIYGEKNKTGVMAMNIKEMDCIAVSDALNRQYGIAVRSGLHCAPSAHRTLGTIDTGCIRFSFGYFTQKNELDQAAYAISQIVKKGV